MDKGPWHWIGLLKYSRPRCRLAHERAHRGREGGGGRGQILLKMKSTSLPFLFQLPLPHRLAPPPPPAAQLLESADYSCWLIAQ